MLRSQFATAVLADEKWVENAAWILRRTFRYTPVETRWLGLVRVFNQEIGVTLARAAELADEALRYKLDSRSVTLGCKDGGDAGVVIDLARFHSTHAAALSTALTLGGTRRRGRKPATRKGITSILARAADYGVDIDLLREGLKMSPRERLERLDANAAFANELRRSTKSPPTSPPNRR
jgi:hypothetical protein